MRRLASLLVLLLAALLAPVPAANAAPIGGLVIVPGESIDTAAIRVRTSGPCPAQADAIYASAKGSGFPPQGQVVAPNTAAGMSHSAGFDVYFAETMKDFAADNNTTLKGRYDITVFCIDSFTQNSFGEFVGSMRFATPTKFEAVGTAKPTGTPPPPAPVAPAPQLPSSALVPVPTAAAPADDGVAAPRMAESGPDVLLIVLIIIGVAAVIIVLLALRRRRHSAGAAVIVLLALLAGHHPPEAVAEQPGVSIGVVIPTTTTTTNTTTVTSTTTTETPTTTTTPPVAAEPPHRLSFTGASVRWLVVAGLALLVLGAITLLLTRRRRASHHK